MSARTQANDIASLEVYKVKRQITDDTGINSPNLSIDQLVRLAAKDGFKVVISCVRVKP